MTAFRNQFASSPPHRRVMIFGHRKRFETLDANGNMLTHLPVGFGALRLRSLRLSYNRLETLRHEVFRPTLKRTLRQLWLSNNNLLQLPDSLIEARTPTYADRRLECFVVVCWGYVVQLVV